MKNLLEYVEREELERRWTRVRRFMQADALIVLQNVDQFYLTGTLQNAVLWFPREGEPIFAVRKSYERAKIESPLKNIVPLKSFSELPGLIPNPGGTLGFEFDATPVALFQQIAKQFPNSKHVDGMKALREARAVKTPYEIDCMRRAASILDKAFLDIPAQLREGLAEFELTARIEYVMRMAEHQGLLRVRRFNMYPAVESMGSRRQLKAGDPVMVNVSGGYAGYIADGSRTYMLGAITQQMRDTHQFVLDLNHWIEEQLRPNAIQSEIYSKIQSRAGENQVKFVAHSVGLELDETPVIGPKSDAPLETGTVLAVELKAIYPGLGGVGLGNTYVLTESGCERLTKCPQEINCGK